MQMHHNDGEVLKITREESLALTELNGELFYTQIDKTTKIL